MKKNVEQTKPVDTATSSIKLETLQKTNTYWKQIDVTWCTVGEIKTDDRLQPRKLRTETHRNQNAEERASATQIDNMYAQLKTSAKAELDPLQVADIEGVLYVVDGHHRLMAYHRANRAIPARVYKTDWKTAIAVSRIVNNEGRARALTTAMAAEQCWQHLMEVTHNATRPLPPKGYSDRDLAAAFGIGYKTAQRMKRRINRQLRGEKAIPKYPEDITELDIDASTGMVMWKFVNKAKGAFPWEDLDDDQREIKKKHIFMKGLAKLHKRIEDDELLRLIGEYLMDCLSDKGSEEFTSMLLAIQDHLEPQDDF